MIQICRIYKDKTNWSSHYNNVPIPEEGLHVNAEGVCEGDACNEGEPAPRVLDNIEQDKEEGSKKEANNDPHG